MFRSIHAVLPPRAAMIAAMLAMSACATAPPPSASPAAALVVGQQATMVLFGARLLGHPIRLYDGSMNDWETRKLPLENATAPKPPERK